MLLLEAKEAGHECQQLPQKLVISMLVCGLLV